MRGIKASEFIIISAISKLHGSSSKEKTGDYFNTTVLPEIMGIKAVNLNSKTYWEMFEKIISEKELKEKKRACGKELNSIGTHPIFDWCQYPDGRYSCKAIISAYLCILTSILTS